MAKRRPLGSIPTCRDREVVFAGVIQLVECQLPKLDVAGSSPVARSFQSHHMRSATMPPESCNSGGIVVCADTHACNCGQSSPGRGVGRR
jgi:hypothetical protein